MQVEESHLEQSLRQAADDPAYRPDFYRALLDADVYVLGEAEMPEAGAADPGEQISIQNWTRTDGSTVIPFFSSVSALQRAVDTECNYLQLSARALFEITKGAALFLNPQSDYGKEFRPDEIEALLLSGRNRLAELTAIPDATQVYLGQPKVYPGQMVDALTTLLAGRAQVAAAYLALMLAPSVDSKPHLLVGIRADGDAEHLLREASTLASACAPSGEPVDLTLIVPGEDSLSDYFLHSVAPFYERSWGARLMPGAGHA